MRSKIFASAILLAAYSLLAPKYASAQMQDKLRPEIGASYFCTGELQLGGRRVNTMLRVSRQYETPVIIEVAKKHDYDYKDNEKNWTIVTPIITFSIDGPELGDGPVDSVALFDERGMYKDSLRWDPKTGKSNIGNAEKTSFGEVVGTLEACKK